MPSFVLCMPQLLIAVSATYPLLKMEDIALLALAHVQSCVCCTRPEDRDITLDCLSWPLSLL